MYSFRQIALAEEVRQVVKRRRSYSRDAPVMHQKAFLCLLPDSLDFCQGGFNLALAPEAPVEGDSETVGLVTNTLEKFQCRGVAVYEQRIRVAHTDYLLQPLGQADHRQFLCESKFGQCLERKVQLALASVNDYELWQVIRGLGGSRLPSLRHSHWPRLRS